jgi:hypothetical protein
MHFFAGKKHRLFILLFTLLVSMGNISAFAESNDGSVDVTSGPTPATAVTLGPT